MHVTHMVPADLALTDAVRRLEAAIVAAEQAIARLSYTYAAIRTSHHLQP